MTGIRARTAACATLTIAALVLATTRSTASTSSTTLRPARRSRRPMTRTERRGRTDTGYYDQANNKLQIQTP